MSSFGYIGKEPLQNKIITKSSLDSSPVGSSTANTVKGTSFRDNNGNSLVIRDSANNIIWGG